MKYNLNRDNKHNSTFRILKIAKLKLLTILKIEYKDYPTNQRVSNQNSKFPTHSSSLLSLFKKPHPNSNSIHRTDNKVKTHHQKYSNRTLI